MKKPRREFLGAGAALGAAAVAACATPGPCLARNAGALFAAESRLVPVGGTRDLFPVRRIFCVARNFAPPASAGPPDRHAPPFFFRKPAAAIQVARPGTTVDHPYPPLTRDYHPGIELVACLDRGGRDIPVEKALEHVYGYAAGLDMTRRDLERAPGEPSEPAKSFDHSAVIGHIHRACDTGRIAQGPIRLKVNGNVRQAADLGQMAWSVAEQIARLSTFHELVAGDILYCGSPRSAGPVVRGDVMTGHVEGLHDISVRVV